MKTEAALLSQIAAAPTLAEQRRLVGELDALRNSKTALAQQDRDWDAAGTVVEQTLTPVLAHSMHTASTDWLSEADIPRVDPNVVHAEAALWFGKTSSMVKQDADEFAEQAKGVARRLASQFGEAAPEAQALFLDYVAFLHRREAASGLDQIQQTVDSHENVKPTPLPEQTYDTFMDPIDPMNQGVDEMQSTLNAPLLNEILQAGQGQGQAEQPNMHSTAPMTSQPAGGGSGMQVGASLVDAPTPAVGYLYNMDDFLRSQAAIQQTAAREHADDSEDSPSSDLRAQAIGGQYDREEGEEGEDHCADCGTQGGYGTPGAACEDCHGRNDAMGICPSCQPPSQRSGWEREHMSQAREASRKTAGEVPDSFKANQFGKAEGGDESEDDEPEVKKEAASGLDQVEQVVDSQENPRPTPLPLDVAFPLIPYFQGGGKQAESAKIASSVDEMLKAPQAGSDNPMLGKTHDKSEKKADEPKNAMEQATKKASLDKTAAADFRKGAAFAANWKPGQPIVRQGSVAFEAGLYAGMTKNAAVQGEWIDEHEKWNLTDRLDAHAKFSEAIKAQAGTTTDWDGLDGMTPGQGSPGPTTPIQGPGEVPPMAGGMDPAAPGGAAPYNGAAPYSKPVAPDPGWTPQEHRQAAFKAAVAARLAEMS